MKMANFKTLMVISMVCFVTGGAAIPPGPDVDSAKSTDSIIPPGPVKSSTPQPPPPPPSSSTVSTTTTTTTKTTTPETTTTTTTTIKPTTSITTTIKPTTSTTSATSTTTTPTTSTKPTTVKPTTPPTPVDPKQGKWVANYTNTNITCLILEAAMQIDVPYKDGNATKMFPVNIPPTAISEGKCGSDVESITLSFDIPNVMVFNFKKTNDSKYDLASIIVTLNVTLPGQKDSQIFVMAHNKTEFTTPLSNSYKCGPVQVLNLTSVPAKTEDYVGQLRISHFQVQAYRNATNSNFDEALDCVGSETPDVVPIAVGCALAALVIIVLIAYLIGRRRSQARGYLSM